MVARMGFDPMISAVKGRRVSQLHYRAMKIGSKGWLRSSDTKIFSLLLYRAELPWN